MLKLSAMAIGFLLGLAELGVGGTEPSASRPEPGIPADFKLVIELYGAGKKPVGKTEVVVHQGRAYHFDPGPPLEVIINDPRTDRLELLNLKMKVHSEVSFKTLDEFQTRLHKAITDAVAKREAQGGKANQVEAAMSRDLIDPRFSANYDAKAHRLRLTNSSVEVEARGEPEADRARLALIHSTLAALARLDSVRNPRDIPPFPQLETLQALIVDRHLRPTELTFIYRLAGPPEKRRWTFRMVPSLTARELEAIARVDAVQERSRFTRFRHYGLPEKKK